MDSSRFASISQHQAKGTTAGIVVWFVFAPLGFDYRSKLANPRWRSVWDWALFAGGTAPKAQLGTLSSTASPPINPSVARTRK